MKNYRIFNRILFPTDGSLTAKTAAEIFASQIAPDSKAHVAIVSVLSVRRLSNWHFIRPFRIEEPSLDEEVMERHNSKMREKAQEALDITARIFEDRNISHSEKIIEGDPVSISIAREADGGEYDMIALASHGLGLERNDLHYLGSVTEHIICRVAIPVLVIPIRRQMRYRLSEVQAS